ncbi:MAG: hypothetical protein JNL87_01100 [Burkholderiaceae bacterium]|nr:hypothetical protein [Burkholderiaceae bacterium]
MPFGATPSGGHMPTPGGRITPTPDKPNAHCGITAREALRALAFEAQLVAVAAENIARGLILGDGDRARLLVSWARITTIVAEVG